MERNNNFYFSELKTYAVNQIKDRLKKAGVDNLDGKPVYVIYARRSTKDKKHQERSLGDQIKACQKLAKDLGLTVIKILKEQESAKKANKRDVFDEMMRDIKLHRYNSIIAWLPDRLSRNMKEAGEIIDLLDKNTIIDLKFPNYIFNKDANGLMALGIQFVLSKQYSDTLSITSTRGSGNIAKEGRSPNKRPKYGYVVNKQRYFRPDGHSFELFRKAVEMALDKVSLEEIAKYLNNKPFLFRKKPTRMSKQKLSEAFKDTFYPGLYVYGTETIELRKLDPKFTPLMTPEEFFRLRRLYDEVKGYKKKTKRDLLFHKMVRCAYCGNLMTPNVPGNEGGQPGYLYIICSNKTCDRYLLKDKKIKKSVRGKVIFDFIIQTVRNNLQLDKDAYQEYVKQTQIQLHDERENLIQQRRLCDKTIKGIENDIGEASVVLRQSHNEKVRIEFDNKISDFITLKEQEFEKKEKLGQAIMDIDEGIRQSSISFESFLNFFKHIDTIIQNSDNRLLIDKIIRMVFLNFTVDDTKVVSHQLNPHFEKYLKLPSVLNSRSSGT